MKKLLIALMLVLLVGCGKKPVEVIQPNNPTDNNLTNVEQNSDNQGKTVYGDLNSDGVVDTKDLNALSKYFRKEASLTDDEIKMVDVFNDGKIDEMDYAILSQGKPVTELHNCGGWSVEYYAEDEKTHTSAHVCNCGKLTVPSEAHNDHIFKGGVCTLCKFNRDGK